MTTSNVDFSKMPANGRRATFEATLETLHEKCGGRPVNIVEIGTSRNTIPAAMLADGWSTRVWAWYAAAVGGAVTTVDVAETSMASARVICADYHHCVTFVVADGADWLTHYGSPIDLLYMDGPGDSAFHLACIAALVERPKFILFDDVCPTSEWKAGGSDDPLGTKAKTAIPRLLSGGYQLLWHERFTIHPPSGDRPQGQALLCDMKG